MGVNYFDFQCRLCDTNSTTPITDVLIDKPGCSFWLPRECRDQRPEVECVTRYFNHFDSDGCLATYNECEFNNRCKDNRDEFVLECTEWEDQCTNEDWSLLKQECPKTCGMCSHLTVNSTIRNLDDVTFEGWEVVYHNVTGAAHSVMMTKTTNDVKEYKTYYFELNDCYDADACPLFCTIDRECPLDHTCIPGTCGPHFDSSLSCCSQSEERVVVMFELFLNETKSPMNISRYNDYSYDLIYHLKRLLNVDEVYAALNEFPTTYGELTKYVYDWTTFNVNRTKDGLPIVVAVKTSNPSRIIQRVFEEDFGTEIELRMRINNPAVGKMVVKKTNATNLDVQNSLRAAPGKTCILDWDCTVTEKCVDTVCVDSAYFPIYVELLGMNGEVYMESESANKTFTSDTWTALTLDANRFDITKVDPDNQKCVIEGSDYLTGHLFTFLDLDVVCTDTYFVGGTVTGLWPTTQIMISNNGNDFLTVTGNGDFVFEKSCFEYDIQVVTEPRGQTCELTQCVGVVDFVNYYGCVITCSKFYSVSGFIHGSTGMIEVLSSINDIETVFGDSFFHFKYDREFLIYPLTIPSDIRCALVRQSTDDPFQDVADIYCARRREYADVGIPCLPLTELDAIECVASLPLELCLFHCDDINCRGVEYSSDDFECKIFSDQVLHGTVSENTYFTCTNHTEVRHQQYLAFSDWFYSEIHMHNFTNLTHFSYVEGIEYWWEMIYGVDEEEDSASCLVPPRARILTDIFEMRYVQEPCNSVNYNFTFNGCTVELPNRLICHVICDHLQGCHHYMARYETCTMFTDTCDHDDYERAMEMWKTYILYDEVVFFETNETMRYDLILEMIEISPGVIFYNETETTIDEPDIFRKAYLAFLASVENTACMPTVDEWDKIIEPDLNGLSCLAYTFNETHPDLHPLQYDYPEFFETMDLLINNYTHFNLTYGNIQQFLESTYVLDLVYGDTWRSYNQYWLFKTYEWQEMPNQKRAECFYQREVFTIAGTVHNLEGSVKFQDSNVLRELTVYQSGSRDFFPMPFQMVERMVDYDIEIVQYPVGQICFIENCTGTATHAITDLSITCYDNKTVKVHISGLSEGERITLYNEDEGDFFHLYSNGWHSPDQTLFLTFPFTLVDWPEERYCESWYAPDEMDQYVACPINLCVVCNLTHIDARCEDYLIERCPDCDDLAIFHNDTLWDCVHGYHAVCVDNPNLIQYLDPHTSCDIAAQTLSCEYEIPLLGYRKLRDICCYSCSIHDPIPPPLNITVPYGCFAGSTYECIDRIIEVVEYGFDNCTGDPLGVNYFVGDGSCLYQNNSEYVMAHCGYHEVHMETCYDFRNTSLTSTGCDGNGTYHDCDEDTSVYHWEEYSEGTCDSESKGHEISFVRDGSCQPVIEDEYYHLYCYQGIISATPCEKDTNTYQPYGCQRAKHTFRQSAPKTTASPYDETQTCYSCDGTGTAHITNYKNDGGLFNITLDANGVCTPVEESGYYQLYCLEFGIEFAPCSTQYIVYPYRCVDGVRHDCGDEIIQYVYEYPNCTGALVQEPEVYPANENCILGYNDIFQKFVCKSSAVMGESCSPEPLPGEIGYGCQDWLWYKCYDETVTVMEYYDQDCTGPLIDVQYWIGNSTCTWIGYMWASVTCSDTGITIVECPTTQYDYKCAGHTHASCGGGYARVREYSEDYCQGEVLIDYIWNADGHCHWLGELYGRVFCVDEKVIVAECHVPIWPYHTCHKGTRSFPDGTVDVFDDNLCSNLVETISFVHNDGTCVWLFDKYTMMYCATKGVYVIPCETVNLFFNCEYSCEVHSSGKEIARINEGCNGENIVTFVADGSCIHYNDEWIEPYCTDVDIQYVHCVPNDFSIKIGCEDKTEITCGRELNIIEYLHDDCQAPGVAQEKYYSNSKCVPYYGSYYQENGQFYETLGEYYEIQCAQPDVVLKECKHIDYGCDNGVLLSCEQYKISMFTFENPDCTGESTYVEVDSGTCINLHGEDLRLTCAHYGFYTENCNLKEFQCENGVLHQCFDDRPFEITYENSNCDLGGNIVNFFHECTDDMEGEIACLEGNQNIELDYCPSHSGNNVQKLCNLTDITLTLPIVEELLPCSGRSSATCSVLGVDLASCNDRIIYTPYDCTDGVSHICMDKVLHRNIFTNPDCTGNYTEEAIIADNTCQAWEGPSYYKVNCVPMAIERIYCDEEADFRKFFGCRGDTIYGYSGGKARITQFEFDNCGGSEVHVWVNEFVGHCLDYQGDFFQVNLAEFALEMMPCPYMTFYSCTDGVQMSCTNDLLTYERFDDIRCFTSVVYETEVVADQTCVYIDGEYFSVTCFPSGVELDPCVTEIEDIGCDENGAYIDCTPDYIVYQQYPDATCDSDDDPAIIQTIGNDGQCLQVGPDVYKQRFCVPYQITTTYCKAEVNALYPYTCSNRITMNCNGWNVEISHYTDDSCSDLDYAQTVRREACKEVFGGFHKLYCLEYGIQVQVCDPLQDLFVFPFECTDGRSTDCNTESGLLNVQYFKDDECSVPDYNNTYSLEPRIPFPYIDTYPGSNACYEFGTEFFWRPECWLGTVMRICDNMVHYGCTNGTKHYTCDHHAVDYTVFDGDKCTNNITAKGYLGADGSCVPVGHEFYRFYCFWNGLDVELCHEHQVNLIQFGTCHQNERFECLDDFIRITNCTTFDRTTYPIDGTCSHIGYGNYRQHYCFEEGAQAVICIPQLAKDTYAYGCNQREFYSCNETAFYIEEYESDDCGGGLQDIEYFPNDGFCVWREKVNAYMSMKCHENYVNITGCHPVDPCSYKGYFYWCSIAERVVYVRGHCGYSKIVFGYEICEMTSSNAANGERRICLENDAIYRTECEYIQEFTTTTTTTTEATPMPQELLEGTYIEHFQLIGGSPSSSSPINLTQFHYALSHPSAYNTSSWHIVITYELKGRIRLVNTSIARFFSSDVLDLIVKLDSLQWSGLVYTANDTSLALVEEAYANLTNPNAVDLLNHELLDEPIDSIEVDGITAITDVWVGTHRNTTFARQGFYLLLSPEYTMYVDGASFTYVVPTTTTPPVHVRDELAYWLEKLRALIWLVGAGVLVMFFFLYWYCFHYDSLYTDSETESETDSELIAS